MAYRYSSRIAALLVLSACSSPPPAPPIGEHYEGPDKALFLKPETALNQIRDPMEPFNRTMSGFNHGLIVCLVDPLSTGWGWITGKAVRDSIDRFFENLGYPKRLFGNLLQAEGGGAWRETERFFINLTVGIIGFFDPAKSWGIEGTEENFGRAFARWGWTPSNYLVLPYFGPKTSRDTTALPFDLAFDIATYVPGGSILSAMNSGTDLLPKYYRFVHSNYDPYQRGRYAFMLNNELRPGNYKTVPSHDRSVETLGAVYLSNRNEKFPEDAEHRAVHVIESGHELPYDLWLQPGPAPVVCILPGLGGHRISGSAYGLAEMAWRSGYSAITISNAMNWEFIQNGASVDVPGFAPTDAHDVQRALGLILADVDKEYPGRITKKAVLGISLGAFHTLFMAARDGGAGITTGDAASQGVLPNFDAYVAINPPVRFQVGMDRLDAFFDAPTVFPKDEQAARVDAILAKALALYKSGKIEPGNLLPFDKIEAEFLIGLSFRSVLNDIIVSSQDRKDLGVLKAPRSDMRTAEVYAEAIQYSYREYMLAFVLPYYHKLNKFINTPEDLLNACDVRPFADAYKANKKLFVFTNTNDFLLEPSDLEWVRQTFGPDRLILETEGSHLGNLYEPKVQDAIMAKLKSVLGQ